MTEIVLAFVLAFICAGLGFIAWRMRIQKVALALEVQRLREQTGILQKQLEGALLRIAELEKPDSTANGLLEKNRIIRLILDMGIPGLIFSVVVGTSGFAGAAALTSSLAMLGGPLGMFGGIGFLVSIVPISRILAQYGAPHVYKLIFKGLLARGHSPQSIRDQIGKYPQWIISGKLRSKIEEVLVESE